MKALKNFVHLIGHTGRDVDYKTFEGGVKRAAVSLATTESYKNPKGEYVNTTTWHNIIAWGILASQLAELPKGSFISLQGKITYRKYESKGQTAYITEIVLDDFIKNEKKKEISAPMPSEVEQATI